MYPPKSLVRRRHVEVPNEVLDHMRTLTDRARRCNRHTQPGFADDRASRNLTWLLTYLVKERLVPVNYLARELNISASAVSQRVKEGVEHWENYVQSSGVIRAED